MFGAVGLYRGDIFFAIISDSTLYFKVDDSNRDDYERRHMPQFRPFPDRPSRGRPGHGMGYYEVPAEIIEDPEECVAWALRSVAAAGKKAVKRSR